MIFRFFNSKKRNARNGIKVNEKTLKKVLTFEFRFAIINKHFARGSR